MDDEKRTVIERPKTGRRLHTIGLLISISWLMGIGIFAYTDYTEFATLAPNEIGDFFGGAFAPLAFLWLVLGFFQQGEELRHSADALWLQGRELQNSVEQQRELVNVTREQLQFESEMLAAQQEEVARRSQPIIELRQGGNMGSVNGMRSHTFRVANVGKPATAVLVNVDGQLRASQDVLPTGGQLEFNKDLPTGNIVPFEVDISYLDERSLSGSKAFRVSGSQRYAIKEIGKPRASRKSKKKSSISPQLEG